MKKQRGFGIIEVIVALTIVVIVAVVIGRVLASIQRVYNASQLKTEAYTYAQQPLEILNEIKNGEFGCKCGSGASCFGNICTRTSDSQTCPLVEPYESCWTRYPEGLSGSTEFYLQKTGSDWELVALSPGTTESVPENNYFSRKLTIQNLFRDASGNLAQSGTEDYNSKKVTAEVLWTDRGINSNVSLTTFFTAWQNL